MWGRGIGAKKIYTHLRYPLNFILVCHRHVMGGIPLPSRGIVGKNRRTQSKTTVRSKRVGPLGPLYLDPTVISFKGLTVEFNNSLSFIFLILFLPANMLRKCVCVVLC